MSLSPDSSILPRTAQLRQVMAVIDASPAKIALLVDPDGRLVGTMTDGDIRRALLSGADLAAPAENHMFRNFQVARDDDEQSHILARLRARGLRQMPVVDAAGRVVRIETLVELLVAPKPNWVFLLAGGAGVRLRPLTESVPKPMLPVAGKPVLETILERFVEAGFRRFCMAVHYLAEQVKAHFGDGSDWGVEIVYVDEPRPLGTAGALALMPSIPDSPLLVMNGDVLTGADFGQLLDYHQEHDAAATLCLRQYDIQVPYGTVEVNGPWATGIVEKPLHKVFVNAGIYVLGPEALALVPKERRYDMTDLLAELIARDRPVATYPLHETWLDIGRLEDYRKADQVVESLPP